MAIVGCIFLIFIGAYLIRKGIDMLVFVIRVGQISNQPPQNLFWFGVLSNVLGVGMVFFGAYHFLLNLVTKP